MSINDLRTIWFALIGILIAGYAVLDGFDLGVGILHLFTKNKNERRIHLNAIGPIWDGNEVWLITAGGALFAAFPIVYATAFSAFYLAFMLLLAALIFRAVSLEFRGKVESERWRRFWDFSFWLGSLLPALLYGIAVGNILKGIPLDSSGVFTGSFPGLLNPYALLIGLLSLVAFTMHGALYMSMKTSGEFQMRMSKWASGTWIVFVLLYLGATLATIFVAPYLFDDLPNNFLFWIFLPLLLASILYMPIALRAQRFLQAFLSSSLMIVSMIGLAAVSLFPRLVPSNIDQAYSLTIHNASSSERTLTVMLIMAAIGMPIVIGYTIYIYRVFKGKTIVTEESY